MMDIQRCPPYPPEFRRQIVELVRTGRTPEEVAEEFEPSASAIRNWVRQADRDEGRRKDRLTTEEREELRRLRQENKQLRLEREILKKAAAWFAREVGVRPSMGSVGDAYDNALCESFLATLECELLDQKRFRTQAEAKMAVFDFIEGLYNPRRRHSALGYESPINFELRHAAAGGGLFYSFSGLMIIQRLDLLPPELHMLLYAPLVADRNRRPGQDSRTDRQRVQP